MSRPIHATLAAWLLIRFASTYERDALIGDLLEEFAQGRSRRWLWAQAFAALRVHGVGRLRSGLRVLATGRLLVVAAELLAAFAVLALGTATLTWGGPVNDSANRTPTPVERPADR